MQFIYICDHFLFYYSQSEEEKRLLESKAHEADTLAASYAAESEKK